MEYDEQAETAYTATIAECVRLTEKIMLLSGRLAESLEVVTSISERAADRMRLDVLNDGLASLQISEVPGRGPVGRIVRKRRARPAAGEIVRRTRGTSETWPTAPAFVYLLLNMDGVLYIGSTVDPRTRMTAHRSKPWTHADLIACETVAEAEALEADLIFQHKPPLNRRDTFERRAPHTDPPVERQARSALMLEEWAEEFVNVWWAVDDAEPLPSAEQVRRTLVGWDRRGVGPSEAIDYIEYTFERAKPGGRYAYLCGIMRNIAAERDPSGVV